MKIIQKIKKILIGFSKLEYISENMDSLIFFTNIYVKDHFLKNIRYNNPYKTLDTLLTTNKSFIRFGDGELLFILKAGATCFEKFDDKKSDQLIKVWNQCHKDQNIMIGIDDFVLNTRNTITDSPNYYNFTIIANKLNILKIIPILNLNTSYYSQQIFALPPILWTDDKISEKNYVNLNFWNLEEKYYNDSKFYNNDEEGKKIYKQYYKNYYEKIQKIFKNKNIILVCSKEAKFAKNNDLFKFAKSVDFVETSSKIADNNNEKTIFEIDNIGKKYKKNNVICVVSYGVNGKIISYNTHLNGYRVLDMGSASTLFDFFSGKNKLKKYNDRNEKDKFKHR